MTMKNSNQQIYIQDQDFNTYQVLRSISRRNIDVSKDTQGSSDEE